MSCLAKIFVVCLLGPIAVHGILPAQEFPKKPPLHRERVIDNWFHNEQIESQRSVNIHQNYSKVIEVNKQDSFTYPRSSSQDELENRIKNNQNDRIIFPGQSTQINRHSESHSFSRTETKSCKSESKTVQFNNFVVNKPISFNPANFTARSSESASSEGFIVDANTGGATTTANSKNDAIQFNTNKNQDIIEELAKQSLFTSDQQRRNDNIFFEDSNEYFDGQLDTNQSSDMIFNQESNQQFNSQKYDKQGFEAGVNKYGETAENKVVENTNTNTLISNFHISQNTNINQNIEDSNISTHNANYDEIESASEQVKTFPTFDQLFPTNGQESSGFHVDASGTQTGQNQTSTFNHANLDQHSEASGNLIINSENTNQEEDSSSEQVLEFPTFDQLFPANEHENSGTYADTSNTQKSENQISQTSTFNQANLDQHSEASENIDINSENTNHEEHSSSEQVIAFPTFDQLFPADEHENSGFHVDTSNTQTGGNQISQTSTFNQANLDQYSEASENIDINSENTNQEEDSSSEQIVAFPTFDQLFPAEEHESSGTYAETSNIQKGENQISQTSSFNQANLDQHSEASENINIHTKDTNHEKDSSSEQIVEFPTFDQLFPTEEYESSGTYVDTSGTQKSENQISQTSTFIQENFNQHSESLENINSNFKNTKHELESESGQAKTFPTFDQLFPINGHEGSDTYVHTSSTQTSKNQVSQTSAFIQKNFNQHSEASENININSENTNHEEHSSSEQVVEYPTFDQLFPANEHENSGTYADTSNIQKSENQISQTSTFNQGNLDQHSEASEELASGQVETFPTFDQLFPINGHEGSGTYVDTSSTQTNENQISQTSSFNGNTLDQHSKASQNAISNEHDVVNTSINNNEDMAVLESKLSQILKAYHIVNKENFGSIVNNLQQVSSTYHHEQSSKETSLSNESSSITYTNSSSNNSPEISLEAPEIHVESNENRWNDYDAYSKEINMSVEVFNDTKYLDVLGDLRQPGTVDISASSEVDLNASESVEEVEGRHREKYKDGKSLFSRCQILEYQIGTQKPCKNSTEDNRNSLSSEDEYSYNFENHSPIPSNVSRDVKLMNSSDSRKSDNDKFCPDDFTGLLPVKNNCQKFINCWKGQAYTMTCGPNTLFNHLTNVCDHFANVDCSRTTDLGQAHIKTEPLVDNNLVTKYANKSFVSEKVLNNYVLQEQEPPQNFPGTARNAKYMPSYEAESNLQNIDKEVYIGDECPPGATGQFVYAYDCRQFLNCWQGRGYIQPCSLGTLFNPETLECDHAHKVDCLHSDFAAISNFGQQQQHSASQHSASQQRQTTSANVEPKCPPGASGVFPHPTICNKFLNCANGITYVQECGPGTAFNPLTKVCHHAHEVGCDIAKTSATTDHSENENAASGSITRYHVSDRRPGRPGKNLQFGPSNPQFITSNKVEYDGRENEYQDTTIHNQQGGYDHHMHGHQQGGYNHHIPSSHLVPPPEAQRRHDDVPQHHHGYRHPPIRGHDQNFEGESQYGNQKPAVNSQYDGQHIHESGSRTHQSGQMDHGREGFYHQHQHHQHHHHHHHRGHPETPSYHGDHSAHHQTHRNPYHRRQETYNPNYGPNVHSSHSSTYHRTYDPQGIPEPSPEMSVPGYEDSTYNSQGQPSGTGFQSSRGYRGHETHTSQNTYTHNQGHNRIENTQNEFHPNYHMTSESNIHTVHQRPTAGGQEFRPGSGYQNPNSYLPPDPNMYHRTSGTQHRDYHQISNKNFETDRTISGYQPGQYRPEYNTNIHTSNMNYDRTNESHTNNRRPGHNIHSDSHTQVIYQRPYPGSHHQDASQPGVSNSTTAATHYMHTVVPKVNIQGYRQNTTRASVPYDPHKQIRPGVQPIDRPQYNQTYNPWHPGTGTPSKMRTEHRRTDCIPRRQDVKRPVQHGQDGNYNPNRREPIYCDDNMTPTSSTPSPVAPIQIGQAIPSIFNVNLSAPTTNPSIRQPLYAVPAPSSQTSPSTYRSQPSTPQALVSPLVVLVTPPTIYYTTPLPPPVAKSSNIMKIPPRSAKSNPLRPEVTETLGKIIEMMYFGKKFDMNISETETFDINQEVEELELTNNNRDFKKKHKKFQETPLEVLPLNYGQPNFREKSPAACSDGHFRCDGDKCITLSKICNKIQDCDDGTDEEQCEERIGYEIRLSGSNKTNEGRVEVKAFGVWGYICDDRFGLRDADVICKELGFKLGAAQAKFLGPLRRGPANETVFLMDDVECLGNETSLRECAFNGWGVHDCLPEEAAGLVCRTPAVTCPKDFWLCSSKDECIPTSFLCDNVDDCADGSDESKDICNEDIEVRLADGSNEMEGRVEVKFRGIWGTVCDDDFTDKAARVVCRMLGYNGPALSKKEGFYGQGTGQIWLDQVACFGNESSIAQCMHWQWGENNCGHSEDVGVVCSNSTSLESTHNRGRELTVNDDESTLDFVDDNFLRGNEDSAEIFPVECGVRVKHKKTREEQDEEDGIAFRVIRGNLARIGDYPWQASLRVRGPAQSAHWCGAVLISKYHLLTAAHCLVAFNKGAYFVKVGDHPNVELEVYIERFYVHEDFRKGQHMNNDIALIKLKPDGVSLGKWIRPICLPPKSAEYTPGKNCTISGWGSIQSGKSTPSNRLRAGWVPIQSMDVCRMPQVYGKNIMEGMVCAGELDEGVDACDGDSGGPLACLHDGAFALYGITSWGQHCGRANKPGVYVKVAHYRDWIDEKIKLSMTEK